MRHYTDMSLLNYSVQYKAVGCWFASDKGVVHYCINLYDVSHLFNYILWTVSSMLWTQTTKEEYLLVPFRVKEGIICLESKCLRALSRFCPWRKNQVLSIQNRHQRLSILWPRIPCCSISWRSKQQPAPLAYLVFRSESYSGKWPRLPHVVKLRRRPCR